MSAAHIHAVALLVRDTGVLIRGESGSGKSRLAFALVRLALQQGDFARIVADDRVAVAVEAGRLVARPVPPLAGLIELRGTGIVRMPAEGAAVLRVVVDLDTSPVRHPDESGRETTIAGVRLRRIAARGPEDATAVLWLIRGGFDAIVTVPCT